MKTLPPSLILHFAAITATSTSLLTLGHAASLSNDENAGDDYDGNVVVHSMNDLSFDENNKLSTHYVLYPQEACKDHPVNFFKAPHYGFEFRPVAGEAQAKVFPDIATNNNNNNCPVACVERGVDRSVAHAVMPHKRYNDSNDENAQDFRHWFENNCQRAEVCIMNYHSQTSPIHILWSSSETNSQPAPLLQVGYGERQTRCFTSFIGHTLHAHEGDRNPDNNSTEKIGHFRVEHITVRAFGVSPPSGDAARHNFDVEIERTLHHEWSRHQRVTRTFSPLGFRKGRLPADVFASMGAFYYNNRHNKVREEWKGKGVFVNWWETDCSFIQIPWAIKAIWQDRLRLLVEAWAGVSVEQTDMYGLRQYEAGARLLTHVDREATHAVSLIVNVAQGNLTEPWPVEVQDHMDRLHEVVMTPGDVVYYESAKCLHGRNRPLTGPNAYYVNLFTHYRPVGDPDWFTKENIPGTPEPVMQVEGECRLAKMGTTALPQGQLGLVEAVKCDDARLGPYVSPSLFTATGGDDLIDWWRKTAPPAEAGAADGGMKDEL